MFDEPKNKFSALSILMLPITFIWWPLNSMALWWAEQRETKRLNKRFESRIFREHDGPIG